MLTQWIESLGREVRLSLRRLLARPSWTAAAIGCLAVATGANTAAFTLINGLLLRPLPFDEPNHLVMVARRDGNAGTIRPFSLRDYRALAGVSPPGLSLLARTYYPVRLTAPDGTRIAEAELVSGNYFDVLRVSPRLGTFFGTADNGSGRLPVAVMSERLWRNRFNSSAEVVGQAVLLNGRPIHITGVAPEGFVGATQLIAADLWLPAFLYEELAGSPDAGAEPVFGVMGRMGSGVTRENAAATLTSLMSRLSDDRDIPGSSILVTAASGFGVPPSVHGVVARISTVAYVLMALLVAVASANVAALMLARGTARRREIAIRLSMGASRGKIAQQLLVEGAVLSVLGCSAGSLVAAWAVQSFVGSVGTPFEYVSYAIDVGPDLTVFAYAAITAAVVTILSSLAPIRSAWRVDLRGVLNRGAAKGGSLQSTRSFNALIVAQFSACTLLLLGAGLVGRSYQRTQHAVPAFDVSGLVAATIHLEPGAPSRTGHVHTASEIVSRLSSVAGMELLAVSREAPFAAGPVRRVLRDTGRTTGAQPVHVEEFPVSSAFFRILGAPLVQGRMFDSQTRPALAVPVVVNSAMANRLWPSQVVVGQRFFVADMGGQTFEVTGIVADLERTPEGRSTRPAFYSPLADDSTGPMAIVARVNGAPAAVVDEVNHVLRSLGPDVAILGVRTVQQIRDGRTRQQLLPLSVFGFAGVLALVLSAIGLHGVIAHGVRERTRELGIRLALGARPADIRLLVVRRGLSTVGLGLAVGLTLTAVLLPVARSMLSGLGSVDLGVVVTVVGVLLIAAVAALYMPARRASSIEPMASMRED